MSQATSRPSGPQSPAEQQILFWACFAALIATSFAFIIRALTLGDICAQFNLNSTQQGEIFGAGLWPFAISIILFSLVIDRIGYGRAMVFAFVCHIASAIITIMAPKKFDPYWSLYVGNFIAALAAGTVEAVINPVVATLFSKEKVKWLNILHAGWPGGLVLGGIIVLLMGPKVPWEYKVAILFLPTLFYGIFMLGKKFPVQERVAAGVSYMAMLQEAGFLGCFIATGMIVWELSRVFMSGYFTSDMNHHMFNLVITLLISVPFGLYVKALGRPIFIVLLLIMIPQATTELGIDGWVSDLMGPQMETIGLAGGWVLVYTSLIMMVLRFCAGAIVHRIKPLTLLAACSAIAVIGLLMMSQAQAAVAILAAATLYGVGKTFFWPTILGIAAEQYPRGGALTLNTIGGVGMLGVGVVGMAMFGNVVDRETDKMLAQKNAALHAQIVGPELHSVFGPYRAIDSAKIAALPEPAKSAAQKEVADVAIPAKQSALKFGAILPGITCIAYILLMGYFSTRGGYKAVEIAAGHA